MNVGVYGESPNRSGEREMSHYKNGEKNEERLGLSQIWANRWVNPKWRRVLGK